MSSYSLITKKDSIFRQISKFKTANNYITKDISPNFSLATTSGFDYLETEITQYDRIYFVLTGVLELSFGEDKITVNPNDSIFIKTGTTCTISGTFNAVVVNQPAFKN